MNSKPAQPAPKKKPFTLREQIKLTRLVVDGKCHETIGKIMGVCQRKARREIDRLYSILGVEKLSCFVHAVHAHGLVWACTHEAQDWVERDEEWREAA